MRSVNAATASRVGRPSASMGVLTRTRTRPPRRSQLVPLMAIGTSGTWDRNAKYAAPSLRGSNSASRWWIRPSPAIATTAPVEITAATSLVEDLEFDSIDVIQFVVAMENAFESRSIGFQNLLMQDGRYVDDLTVGQIEAFIASRL